jgi:hypothetical protein
MQTFKLHLKDGHPIIHNGSDILLLDTGASHTIHQSDSLDFLGTRHHCASEYMGITTQKISGMAGTPITTLLGADVLSRYQVLLDYRGGTVQFSEQDIPFEGDAVSVSDFMGIPIIELTISGNAVRCFLDSGAKLSYMPIEITQDHPKQGVLEDFYPMIGTFHTESYLVPATFLGNSLTIKCGNLPELFQAVMGLAGVKGILGYDFFDAYKVLLNLGRKEIRVQQYA